jgi:hypothetical protein
MSKIANNDEEKSRSIASWKVSVILLVIYLFAPFGVQVSKLDELQITYMSYLWAYCWDSIGPYGDPLWVAPFFISSIPYTIFRLLFIVMMNRLYNEKSTKLHTFLTGIVGELQYPIIYLVAFFPHYQRWLEEGFFLSMLPIPILLVAGFVIVLLFPPQKTKLWKRESSEESWWDKSYQYDEQPA